MAINDNIKKQQIMGIFLVPVTNFDDSRDFAVDLHPVFRYRVFICHGKEWKEVLTFAK